MKRLLNLFFVVSVINHTSQLCQRKLLILIPLSKFVCAKIQTIFLQHCLDVQLSNGGEFANTERGCTQPHNVAYFTVHRLPGTMERTGKVKKHIFYQFGNKFYKRLSQFNTTIPFENRIYNTAQYIISYGNKKYVFVYEVSEKSYVRSFVSSHLIILILNLINTLSQTPLSQFNNICTTLYYRNMEEDNRSYHPSRYFLTWYHHHRHHYRVADAEADADSDSDAEVNMATTFKDRSRQTFTDMIVAAEQQQQQEDSSNVINSNSNNDGNRREGNISSEQKLPSLSYLLRTTTNPLHRGLAGTITGEIIVPRPLLPSAFRAVRGMVAVDNNNDQKQPHLHQYHHHQQQQQQQQLEYQQRQQQQQQENYHRRHNRANDHEDRCQLSTSRGTDTTARMNRLLVETHGLFCDYQQQFYRQSLIEKASDLLKQATTAVVVNHDHDHNSIAIAPSSASLQLTLLTDALELCHKSIHNQRQNNVLDNYVGGSDLVAGEIRIRRKNELLIATIYGQRATLFYACGSYINCVNDCDSAIVIWHRFEQRRISRRMRTRMRNQQLPQRRRRTKHKLSHKHHLCLLKSMALAGVERYKHASR